MPEIDILIENLRKKYNFSYSQILELLDKKEEISVPLNIFSNRKLGALEALAKYLKEDGKLKFSEIAKLLNRDQRTIWVSYNNARKKTK